MPGPEIHLHVYDTEEELLQALRDGCPDACTCMVKRYASIVYSQALRLLADPDEAESILQLTFIKACDKIHTFDGRSGLGTWLYRIATNEALMKLRRQHVNMTSIHDIAETIHADDLVQNRQVWSVNPGQIALDNELRKQLEEALLAVPETLRVVFVLREMQGLSTAETAETLGLSENVVKVRLHRARLRLRELLAEYMSQRDEDRE